MTPQLQQAIKLLQLSALDLEQEIQDRITENPMLELEEDEGPAEEVILDLSRKPFECFEVNVTANGEADRLTNTFGFKYRW